MGRCSYKWIEQNEKNELIEHYCSEKSHKSSDYCIFHEKSQEKDSALFMQKLSEKIQKEDYNFRGFYFPDDIIFPDIPVIKFKDNANFSEAVFSGIVSFEGITFEFTICSHN